MHFDASNLIFKSDCFAWLVALLIFRSSQQIKTNIKIGRIPSVTSYSLKLDLWFILVEELPLSFICQLLS